VSFSRPFWRERGASGVLQTPGPLSVWWEGGGGAELGEQSFALVGLGFGAEACAAVARLEAEGAVRRGRCQAVFGSRLGGGGGGVFDWDGDMSLREVAVHVAGYLAAWG
jgi:hypothetical protein